MKIKYPEIVEDCYKKFNAIGIKATREEMYQHMVTANLIDKNCQPTQWALDQGYFDSFSMDENGEVKAENLAAYKRMNPIYAEFDASHFTHTAEGWAVDYYVVSTLSKRVLADPESTPDQVELAKDLLANAAKYGY
ncbi:hypothetical protein [Lacticaseibacillus jixiensis]|uniref:hypothetical protein n=1 Tax=Lacticaseibacillus jixiensis TaxID=3231926 RepID=UPI0036F1EB3D